MGFGLIRSFFLGLSVICCVSWREGVALAAEGRRVEVVHADEMDWPEGRRAIEDELVASGYRVEHAVSRALDVGVLLDELSVGAPAETVARVTVLRVGRTGIAYVWLSASGRTHRVTSGEPDPVRAANILSLRVVELIELGGEGLEAEPVAALPDRSPPPASKEPPRGTPRKNAWILLAGGGVTLGDGLVAPLGSLEMVVGRRLVGLFGVEGSLSVGLHRSRRVFEAGTIGARRQRGAIGLFLWSRKSPWWKLGVNSGIECYQFSWTPESSQNPYVSSACAPSSSLVGQAGVRWKDVTLWLGASASMTHRRLRLIESGDVLATYGRPEGTLSGGVGWIF